MCDFKPGDEVVCIVGGLSFGVRKGASYTVSAILPPLSGVPGCRLAGVPMPGIPPYVGFKVTRFRKVQRRNSGLSIEAFLTIKPGFEEPRRAPAKKRERA